MPSSNNQPLMPEEQEAIIAVIKRAEQLDLVEQERVGYLVERLENMRRKVLGRNPSQCLLCADGFGILKSHKLVCMDCKKPVCQKCAIDTCGAKHCCSKEHWICMICSETREIWKKSGAWFFKSIPKYILPKESSYRNNRNNKKGKSTRSLRDDDSSSDEDWKFRSKSHRRNSSTESTNDMREHCSSQLSSASQPNSSPSSSMQSRMPDFLKPYPSTSAAIDSKGDDSGLDGRTEYSGEGSITSRRELIGSRSLTDWPWSDSRSEGRVSPSTCSRTLLNSMDEHKPIEKPVIDLSLGTMDLSLTYDPVSSTLHCTVYRAKNLIPMDMNGLADPYCKLNILPSSRTSTRLRTKTIHKTRNPEFNENLTFYDISENDLLSKSLHIIVVDDDKYGHDFMGETKINLAKLRVQNTMYLTLALENISHEQRGPLPAPELCQWFDDMWSRGQILLSLCYSTKRRCLLVTVVRCANLLPMDNNGFSDPFVKLQLKPDPHHKKHKTTIKWKELNPTWNEEFAFETRPTELSTQSLFVTVYDKDYGKSNDYLGGLVLGGLGSKGKRLKHWLDMIKYPDHHHQCWHNLSEEILK
ncbi:hypothetical protein WA026_002820 [Henosepilachna vigintioctopunctata]|uniref:Uncharacterized protein n=1 Tax=Henosepilachna vigintioctopunctata TaxID=420089 RepID=A0AAW1U3F3_9CUCU